jgi:type II secretory pathway predicted ATPase ExeA
MAMNNYSHFFGFMKAPFAKDIPVKELYPLPGVKRVSERLDFTIGCGAISIVTGDVGAGKSTALRYASSQLHPSKYQVILITALDGTYLELLRKIMQGIGLPMNSNSPAILTKHIQTALLDIASKKKIPVLLVDEAHLLRFNVFAQLHTLTQFEFDSKSVLPMVLCGQNNLIDSLSYHTSRPLASRVIGRSCLEAISLDQMKQYLLHHLSIAGIKINLFSDEAMLAIHQGSGGFLRKANHLARGALLKAASEKLTMVSPEHVRIASSEIFV